MDMQFQLPKLRYWFEEYVDQFSSDDPIFKENVRLKVEHTHGVCETIRDIGRSLHCSAEDLCLIEAAGLLHDIGRFEQFRQYRTFADCRSENHAMLGVKVIQATRVLGGLEPAAADMIVRLVGYHNRATLPADEDERCLFFLKLLRDADKVDIWRVVTEYYQRAGNHRNKTVELDLPDTHGISAPVYEALMSGKLVQMADLKTLDDFKLLQIGWIYDVYFPRTFQIVRERRYLQKIRDSLPLKCPRITEAYERACAHLGRKSSGKDSA